MRGQLKKQKPSYVYQHHVDQKFWKQTNLNSTLSNMLSFYILYSWLKTKHDNQLRILQNILNVTIDYLFSLLTN